MQDLATVILGLVEGLTEFLPISSTGHLILTGRLLNFDAAVGQDFAQAFEVIIQLGAVLAIVAAYPGRMAGLLQFRERQGFSGLRGIGLLVITTLPAGLLGLCTRKYIHAMLFTPTAVAFALAAGATWILLIERYHPQARTHSIDSLSWRLALGVGLFQCLALWPGMSRSAATIVGGMMLGVDRKAAVEYSFFAAVPIMVAATIYELYKSLPILDSRYLGLAALGLVVSFLSAWLAVRLFVRFVGNHTLTPFGWYRLAVAVVVFGVILA